MKVEVNREGQSLENLDFPCLLESNLGSGLVILATGASSMSLRGVVLDAGNRPYSVGDYKDNWILINFQRFSGSITLES